MEGWNDPPKNVGLPTGNLKISLNKRVAFPLGSSPMNSNTTPTACPLQLPPKPPTSFTAEISSDDSSKKNEEDVNGMKVKVLEILERGVQDLSGAAQSSVAAKLKTLEDDWCQCDIEIKKLLVELTEYLENKDPKNAASVQRKIVMKGCSKQWLHAIRQIIMHQETLSVKEEPLSSADPVPEIQ